MYAQWGIEDILIFDPVDRTAWNWDHQASSLRPVRDHYSFHSLPVKLDLNEVWHRMQQELE
jgi:hypothetical protein